MNYRAALERWAQNRRDRGWREDKPPADQWIEYHATHGQFVYSGRCCIDQLPRVNITKPATHQNIFLSGGQAQIKYLFWRECPPPESGEPWGPRQMDLITGNTLNAG